MHIEVLLASCTHCPPRHTVETAADTVADADQALRKTCSACLESAEDDLVDFRNQLGRRVEASNTLL